MDLNFEKVDVEIKKLKAGEAFIGKLVDMSDRPWVDKVTGEAKTIKQYHFTDTTGKNPFVYFGDAGFVNTLSTAGIKEGDIIKVLKNEKTDMVGGRSVNNYELFKAKLN